MLPARIPIPSVNKNTAKTIISALLASNGITRTELAGTCKVSTMTAGKVVSAMCNVGYAEIGEEIAASGRRSDFIYPSERFTFLIFDIGEHTMSADIYDARDNTRFTYDQPRNQSLDITTDALSFLALVNEQSRDADECDTYRISALLYRKETGLDIKALSQKGIDTVIEKSAAAARYASGRYKNECIAFVGADDGADIRIIADGKLIQGKGNPIKHSARRGLSELEMLDALTAKLSSLFELVMPHKVMIDSRALHLSRRFSDELGERLCEHTAMQKEELPEFVTNDGIPFPSRAVIGQLIDIYAEFISAD